MMDIKRWERGCNTAREEWKKGSSKGLREEVREEVGKSMMDGKVSAGDYYIATVQLLVLHLLVCHKALQTHA